MVVVVLLVLLVEGNGGIDYRVSSAEVYCAIDFARDVHESGLQLQ